MFFESSPMSSSIHTAIRIRPLLPFELERDGGGRCVNFVSPTLLELADEPRRSYDYVFPPSSTNVDVFQRMVSPLVEGCFSGINASVLAYGQTGSGKTHTMLDERASVVPSFARAVFARVEAEEDLVGNGMHAWEVRLSCIEVYRKQLRDLLAEGPSSSASAASLSLRGSEAHGARKMKVTSVDDVTALLVQATGNRATGSHAMSVASSRSHALITFELEHRWRLAAGGWRASTALIRLVDLAGSEDQRRTGHASGSDGFREGCAINLGLCTLANVMRDLTATDHAEGDFVRYRDSLLTQLLQPCLGGNSRSVLLACVSPAASNIAETASTLRFASAAKFVVTRPAAVVREIEPPFPAHPLENDAFDHDVMLGRRCELLHTAAHGTVFARALGPRTAPLILWVHGSGPTNSSAQWSELSYELAVRSCGAFYQVAIDCPGYGRSVPGDRQTVRSEPAAFLLDVIRTLTGSETAHTLVGSSQGSCSIFNAVLAMPTITKFIAVMHPVGHDVFRYSAITQPTLLSFEIEDAGHPVKVGRWMAKSLQRPRFFEWSSRATPFWLNDHFVSELLAMHAETRGGRARSDPDALQRHVEEAIVISAEEEEGKCGEDGGRSSGSVQLVSGLLGWLQAAGRESEVKPIELELLDAPPLAQLRSLAARTARVLATRVATLREALRTRPPQLLSSSPVGSGRGGSTKSAAAVNCSSSKIASRRELRRTWHAVLDEETGMLEYVNALDSTFISVERPEGAGVRIVARAAAKVEESSLFYVAEDTRDTTPVESSKARKRRELAEAKEVWASDERWVAAKKKKQLIIRFGNTADQSAVAAGVGNVATTTFIEVVGKKKGAAAAVHFNINPSYPKSATKVNRSPFELKYSMKRRFPCHMTVHWERSVGAPPITLEYYVRHTLALNTVWLAVILPEEAPRGRRVPKPVVVEVEDDETYKLVVL